MFREALTFDDVLLEPAYTRAYYPSQTDTSAQFDPHHQSFGIPLISAAMDTVTEHRYGDCDGTGRRYRGDPQAT